MLPRASLVVEEATGLFLPEGSSNSELRSEALRAAVRRAAEGVLLIRNIDELAAEPQAQLLRYIRAFETSLSAEKPGGATLPFAADLHRPQAAANPGAGGSVSAGNLLSFERRLLLAAPAARSQRRYPGIGADVHRCRLPRAAEAIARARSRFPPDFAAPPVAGERTRTGKRGPRGVPVQRSPVAAARSIWSSCRSNQPAARTASQRFPRTSPSMA